MSYVAPIVEGHGEVEALPVLLRRIASERVGTHVRVNPPYRVSASSFVKFERDFQKAIQISAGKAADNGGFVLILLDSEDTCPAQLGPRILSEAERERPDVPYVVSLAYREFETWLLFGARSLAGVCGLPRELAPPDRPESLRDAKRWLSDRMPSGYKETLHQAAFASRLDFAEASRSPSFKRMLDRIDDRIRESLEP